MLYGLTQATVVHNPHVAVVVPIDIVHRVWQVDFEGHLVGIEVHHQSPIRVTNRQQGSVNVQTGCVYGNVQIDGPGHLIRPAVPAQGHEDPIAIKGEHFIATG